MIKHTGMGSALAMTSLLFWLTACGVQSGEDAYPPSTSIPPAKLYSGVSVSGSWTPDLSIINGSTSSTKANVVIQKKPKISVTAGMVRLNEAWGSKEVLVNLGTYSASDFGTNGSMTLQAEVSGYSRNGGAYAVLTSFFVDKSGGGRQEYVNLDSSCSASSGIWACSGGMCNPTLNCEPLQSGTGSSFFNRNDWEQHQFQSFGYGSTNSFPRCDAVNAWNCPSGHETLPAGTYYAKYILMSDSGSSVSSLNATLNVTPTIRKDPSARGTEASVNGGIKLNVILVGSRNISDSHTAKGAQNLNLLFQETHRILKDNAGIGINDIKVYEWKDDDGGSYYSQVPIGQVGIMFASATQTLDAADEGSYINVFLVRDIQAKAGSNYSILGVSGGILGSTVNGTQTSGLAFSTHTQAGSGIANYNPTCSVGSCDRNSQSAEFIEMGSTVAHELGHYLGLNHPSETASSAFSQRHDQLSDTPTCAPRTSAGGNVYFDQLACYSDSASQGAPLSSTCEAKCDAAIDLALGTSGNRYIRNNILENLCPTVPECQFNHVMWYTTKNHLKVSGVWQEDGAQFSPQSQAILQWSSFLR